MREENERGAQKSPIPVDITSVSLTCTADSQVRISPAPPLSPISNHCLLNFEEIKFMVEERTSGKSFEVFSRYLEGRDVDNPFYLNA